jgi:His/Glu/Gln/Arg/opine family amino acid ABC transporter permease subunit
MDQRADRRREGPPDQIFGAPKEAKVARVHRGVDKGDGRKRHRFSGPLPGLRGRVREGHAEKTPSVSRRSPNLPAAGSWDEDLHERVPRNLLQAEHHRASICLSILKGVVTTSRSRSPVVVTGLALGLALAVVRSFQFKPFNALIVFFVDMFRALPPLVIVLLVYFGLPNVG